MASTKASARVASDHGRLFVSIFNCRGDSAACANIHVRRPITSAAAPPNHPRSAPRARLSSNQWCAHKSCKSRKLPREYAETVPQHTPATSLLLLPRKPDTKFCEIPTPANTASTSKIFSRCRLPAAKLPATAAPHTADKPSPSRAAPVCPVPRQKIPHRVAETRAAKTAQTLRHSLRRAPHAPNSSSAPQSRNPLAPTLVSSRPRLAAPAHSALSNAKIRESAATPR